MKIETHKGTIADPATVIDIGRTVASLTTIGEAFIVLSKGEDVYIQAAGTLDEKFIVEYRDGGAGDHYRGDHRVAAVDLTTMLVGYLQQTADWRSAIRWHRVRVNQDPLSA